jgi:hypothetical protein
MRAKLGAISEPQLDSLFSGIPNLWLDGVSGTFLAEAREYLRDVVLSHNVIIDTVTADLTDA